MTYLIDSVGDVEEVAVIRVDEGHCWPVVGFQDTDDALGDLGVSRLGTDKGRKQPLVAHAVLRAMLQENEDSS